MMSWSHGFGWGWLVFVVLAVVCVAMMAGMMRHGTSMRHRTSAGTRPASEGDESTPERILARRLASGEIDVQEYERLHDALQRTSSSTADTAETGGAGQHSLEA